MGQSQKHFLMEAYCLLQNYLLLTMSLLMLNYIKSYFEYKTAKPLLYMVYRSRSRKQSGRKWSGKEISFEVVSRTVNIAAEVTSG